VSIGAVGVDEREAVEALAGLVSAGFGEDDPPAADVLGDAGK
jgi:hypothetical protein